jgi:DNA mismatch endonuclease, patch repair protein
LWRKYSCIREYSWTVYLIQIHVYELALFVDGCFWHACPQHGTMPSQAKNNRPFWEKKLAGNVERDAYVTRQLRKMGWKVIRVWEHELKVPARVGVRVKKVLNMK